MAGPAARPRCRKNEPRGSLPYLCTYAAVSAAFCTCLLERAHPRFQPAPARRYLPSPPFFAPRRWQARLGLAHSHVCARLPATHAGACTSPHIVVHAQLCCSRAAAGSRIVVESGQRTARGASMRPQAAASPRARVPTLSARARPWKRMRRCTTHAPLATTHCAPPPGRPLAACRRRTSCALAAALRPLRRPQHTPLPPGKRRRPRQPLCQPPRRAARPRARARGPAPRPASCCSPCPLSSTRAPASQPLCLHLTVSHRARAPVGAARRLSQRTQVPTPT